MTLAPRPTGPATSRTGIHPGVVLLLCIVGLAAGCDTTGREARREYFTSLELAGIGRPLEEQLAHMDNAVRLDPTSALYLQRRGNLLFGLDRAREARADYDRAVELADRPYLRFERADALCALGEYDAALADLDRAIATQPENVQFYPRRALVRLALGRIEASRADVDHAIASSQAGFGERYARAAVLLIEGRPAEAIEDLDYVVANFSDPSHGALPRTVRRLAHAALDQRELAAADFDRSMQGAERHWPYLGYRYWLVPRGCDNAFIATQAGELVAKAETMLATEPPPVFPPAPFMIVERTGTTVTVDLDRKGIDPNAASLATLQLLDEAGVRIAERVAVRRTCRKPCGEESEDECHVVGVFRHSGPPVAEFAVAFEAAARIRPQSLDRAPLSRAEQLGRLERLFAAPVRMPAPSTTVYSWSRSEGAGEWEEQYAWSQEAGAGNWRMAVEKTGIRFADCSLAVFGPLTELACPDRRSAYVGDRHLGGSEGPGSGSLVRYAAEIDGRLAYFVVVNWNSYDSIRILYRVDDAWHEEGVIDDRQSC